MVGPRMGCLPFWSNRQRYIALCYYSDQRRARIVRANFFGPNSFLSSGLVLPVTIKRIARNGFRVDIELAWAPEAYCFACLVS